MGAVCAARAAPRQCHRSNVGKVRCAVAPGRYVAYLPGATVAGTTHPCVLAQCFELHGKEEGWKRMRAYLRAKREVAAAEAAEEAAEGAGASSGAAGGLAPAPSDDKPKQKEPSDDKTEKKEEAVDVASKTPSDGDAEVKKVESDVVDNKTESEGSEGKDSTGTDDAKAKDASD